MLPLGGARNPLLHHSERAQALRGLVRLAGSGRAGKGNRGDRAARTGQPVEREGSRSGGARVPDQFRAGYRVYFGRDGEVLVILLTGGTKKRQQRDIAAAIEMWTDYKQRRRAPR
jgi:putative addiction module killer protein